MSPQRRWQRDLSMAAAARVPQPNVLDELRYQGAINRVLLSRGVEHLGDGGGLLSPAELSALSCLYISGVTPEDAATMIERGRAEGRRIVDELHARIYEENTKAVRA